VSPLMKGICNRKKVHLLERWILVH
jgi:hypothetical protein